MCCHLQRRSGRRCGVLAGVLTVGVGAIVAIDGLGGNQGVKLSYVFTYFPPLPLPVVPYVWHQ